MKAFAAAIAAILLCAGAASAQTITPDGVTLLPGSTGSLTAMSGVWTFNSAGDALLNGVQKTSNWPTELEIAGGGNLYARYGAANAWYVWIDNQFGASPTPSGQAGPPGPQGPMGIPGTVDAGLPVAGSACTLNDNFYNINETSPATASFYLCDSTTLHWRVVGPFPAPGY